MRLQYFVPILLAGLIFGNLAYAERMSEPLRSGIPHGYYWISSIWLNDVDGDTLRHKYYQVIVVNGEPDPGIPGGILVDDCLDSISVTDFNSAEMQANYNMHAPGLIDVQFTVVAGDIVPEDNKVQFGERVLIRIFNADRAETATHYRDSEIWETVEGLHRWWGEWDLFSDWQPLRKSEQID